jgi:hypothetical protein
MTKLPAFLCNSRYRSFLLTVFLTLGWYFITLHAGPLVPLLGWLKPDTAAFFVLAGIAVLLHYRPKSFNGVYGILLFWVLLRYIQMWSAGTDSLFVAKMFIPTGDNSGYFCEATRIIRGTPFTDYAAAHLLSHAYFATMMWITAYNVMSVHVMTAALFVLATSLFAMEVRTKLGGLAAAVCATLVGLFLLDYLGLFLSEIFGLTMGLFGAAGILGGLRTGRLSWQFAGLFFIGIGLAARPGAFFVLPLAGLALATLQPTWKRRGGVLCAMAACVIASLALNAIATRLLSLPDATPMSLDVWHHLNGMLKGTSWGASISTVTAEEARGEVVRMLRENPALVFTASWKAIRYFFVEGTAFAFVRPTWLGACLTWFSLAGAAWCAVRLKEPLARLAALSFAGIVLSIPFLPPWDAGVRTYCATLPLQLLAIVLPLSQAIGLARNRLARTPREAGVPTGAPHPAFGSSLALFMLVTATIVPLLLLHTPLHQAKPYSAYYDGHIWLRLYPGNYLRIIPDTAARHSYMPLVRRSDYLNGNHEQAYTADYGAVYNRLPEGVIITRGDATGCVFVIKDDYGATPPLDVYLDGVLVQLRGDCVAYDKRLGITQESVEAILDSFYMPWLTGYEYYYHYHPVLGMTKRLGVDGAGVVTLTTEHFGTLKTSRVMFPRFTSEDGTTLLLDMEKKILTRP